MSCEPLSVRDRVMVRIIRLDLLRLYRINLKYVEPTSRGIESECLPSENDDLFRGVALVSQSF